MNSHRINKFFGRYASLPFEMAMGRHCLVCHYLDDLVLWHVKDGTVDFLRRLFH